MRSAASRMAGHNASSWNVLGGRYSGQRILSSKRHRRGCVNNCNMAAARLTSARFHQMTNLRLLAGAALASDL